MKIKFVKINWMDATSFDKEDMSFEEAINLPKCHIVSIGFLLYWGKDRVVISSFVSLPLGDQKKCFEDTFRNLQIIPTPNIIRMVDLNENKEMIWNEELL